MRFVIFNCFAPFGYCFRSLGIICAIGVLLAPLGYYLRPRGTIRALGVSFAPLGYYFAGTIFWVAGSSLFTINSILPFLLKLIHLVI